MADLSPLFPGLPPNQAIGASEMLEREQSGRSRSLLLPYYSRAVPNVRRVQVDRESSILFDWTIGSKCSFLAPSLPFNYGLLRSAQT